jgi:hypothetical protein
MDVVPIVPSDAGALAPGRWRWLRALGWMVVVLGAVVASLAVQALLVKLPGASTPTAKAAMSLAVLVLAYLVYAAMVRWGERRPVTELGLAAMPRDLALGLLIGAGMFALVFTVLRLGGLYTLAPGVWSDWPQDVRRAIATGLAEELIARLVIFRLLLRAFGTWPALIVSALLFGAAHLQNPNATYTAALAIAIEAGLMLAAFYLLTGRIWMSVGVHAAWNFTQGPVFGAHVSGTTDTGSLFVSAPVAGAPELLTGGPFGPEASVPAILVGGAIFLWVFAAARRRHAPLP